MYQKDNHSIIKHLDFMLLDLLPLELSYFLMSSIRQGGGYLWKSSSFNLMVGLLVIVHLAVVILSQSYQDILRRGRLVELLLISDAESAEYCLGKLKYCLISMCRKTFAET